MFSPDHMQQAMNMFNNMSPEQKQQMFNTMQQNPNLIDQARNMFTQGQPNMGQTPQNNGSNDSTPVQQEPKQIMNIQKIKNDGDSLFKQKQYQEAGSKYLEGIYEIQDMKTQGCDVFHNQNHKEKLKDLEIRLRNNYCMSKKYLKEEELMEEHSLKVLELDPNNIKALYNLSLSLWTLKQIERCKKYLKKAKEISPKDELILNLEKDVNQYISEQEIQKKQKIHQNEVETKNKNIQNEETPQKSKNKNEKLNDSFVFHDFSMIQSSKKEIKKREQWDKLTTHKLLLKKSQKQIPVSTPQNITQPKKPQTFLERQFDKLLGIFLGLLIAYLLKRN